MRKHHADRNALAVHQPGAVVFGRSLQRMAEGVAEIEQRPQTVLALVRCHDLGLGLAADRDRLDASRAAGKDRLPVLFEPGEEVRLVDQPILRDLGIAGAKLAWTQRVEHVGIGEHQIRLMEDADQVLAVRGIDAGLAADGGIDLCQERGRDLDETRATAHDASGKAGKIADDAPAKRDHRIVALDPGAKHGFTDRDQLLEALGLLAGGKHERHCVDVTLLQARHQGLEVARRYVLVSDHGHLAPLEAGGDLLAGGGNQPGTDQDIIGTIAEVDADLAFGSGRNMAIHGSSCPGIR
ncbi:hypothetical protein D9M68_418800 [compost metagenome]